MKQLFRTVLFYNDLFLILKSSLLSWFHRRQRWLLTGLLGLVLAAGFVLWRRKKNAGPPISHGQAGALPAHWEHVDRFEGLTDDEAAERTEPFDLDEITSQEERQFLVQAIRHNLFTVFNIDIFAIALVMFFLGNVWSTISILGVFLVNLTLNVYQMVFTKKRLDRLLRPLRPQAAVIRSRQVKSIDPADILAGDLLVVGSGDQFLVDGVLLSEQPALIEQVDQNDQARQFEVHSGESIRAGSYCLSGNVVYRASEAGRARYLVAPGSNLNLFLGEKTALQRLIDAILTGLFGLVLAISVLLAINSFMLSNQFLTVEYTNAFSIILGIAPTSLFFILIMQYAFGTFRISERGALVYKAQTIEALSNVSVLCVSKSSLMRGVQVTVEPIAPPDGVRPLSEPVIRRYLGDFLHSLPIYSTTDRLLWDALPGSARRPVEVAAHLSDLGWLGMSFDETDMRGVLVVGLPEALQPNLARPKTPVLREVEQSLVTAQAGLGKLWGRVARRIRRRPEQTEG
ncbi:MAG TPA: hypothetical protein VLS48_03040, partial [Anaerolineales bacterium]|nr:hypothetical protein [Anaerolineales bacterium]